MYAQTAINTSDEFQKDWRDEDKEDCDPAIKDSWRTSEVFDNIKPKALSEEDYNVDELERHKDKKITRNGHKIIIMTGSPIPIARSIMHSRCMSATEGSIDLGDARR
jgi:hypothetical protein